MVPSKERAKKNNGAIDAVFAACRKTRPHFPAARRLPVLCRSAHACGAQREKSSPRPDGDGCFFLSKKMTLLP
jgi:hypothetical protein